MESDMETSLDSLPPPLDTDQQEEEVEEATADTTLTEDVQVVAADTTTERTLEEIPESSISDLNQTLTLNNTDEPTTPPKSTVTTRASSKRGRPPTAAKTGPTPKRKAPARPSARPRDANDSLYSIVLEGKSAIQSVVADWVSRYQKDSEKACLELIQYIVRCCGCRAVITDHQFQHEEASAVIRTLTENFAEDSGDYPLMMAGPTYRKFKVNFSEFMERLISECGEVILYDEYMLVVLVLWLVGLTDSQVRAFRHTSTLACLKIVTGIIKVAKSITRETDNTQRQYDTEMKKSLMRRAKGKIEKLETKLQELKMQLSELHNTMVTMFSSTFLFRYRDICPEIRSICIHELGVWMKEYPKEFLADRYLKYIGWSLSDKAADVRLQAVNALVPLYRSPELVPHVELFTQKFKERLLSMKLDKEEAVQIAVINLCSQLNMLDMLESEDCLEVCELVFGNRRSVCLAAGCFANQYLFSEDFLCKERNKKPPKGCKRPTDAQLKLKELLRFFLEANIHKHTVYIVNSLWDHCEVLQDWETMVSLLSDDASCGVVLTSEGERALIDMLAYSIKKASDTTVITAKGKEKARERKAVEADKEAIASVLIPVLPQLIAKYGSDPDCAANLISIPQHIDMEMYVEMRAQKHFEDFLDHLKQLLLKHSSDEVLREISYTYNHLLSPDMTLHSTVDIAFDQLIDELYGICNQNMQTIKEDFENDANDEDVYNLGVNLKRLSVLFKQVDLTKWTPVDELLNLIDLGLDGNAPDLVITSCLTIIHVHLLWTLHNADQVNPDRSTLRDIHSLMVKLVNHCHNFMRMGSPCTQHHSYIILSDLLIVFSKHLKTTGPFGSLAYSPDPVLQSTMCDYVMEKVFKESDEDDEPTTDEEASLYAEKFYNRRLILAGIVKLLMVSVFDINYGVPVVGQLVKFANDFGDLIKKVLSCFRENDPNKWYRIILKTLQTEYTALLEEGDEKIDHTTAEWADLKDLAKRFALSTGFDLVKYRLPIVCIHREGIKFALQDYDQSTCGETLTPPPQLDFLEVLSEFSFRLLPLDKIGERGLLVFLNEQLGYGMTDVVKNNDDWKPLKTYMASLERHSTEENEAGVTPAKKGGKGSKRKKSEKVVSSNKSARIEAHED